MISSKPRAASITPFRLPLANPSNSDAIPTVWHHSDADPQDFVIAKESAPPFRSRGNTPQPI